MLHTRLSLLLVSCSLLPLPACGGSSSAAPPSLGFGAPQRYPTGGSDGRALAFADLNGDGIGEALIANGGQATVSVLPGRSNAAFDAGSNIPGPVGADSLAVGDLDGNRTADLVVGSSATAEMVLYFNRLGSLSSSSRVVLSTPVRSVRLADLNLDGRADIVWSSASRAELGLLLRDTAGGYLAEQTLAVPDLPGDLVVADFDGDGRPDLATASIRQGWIVVMRNLASGMSPPVRTMVEPQSGAMAAGDVDGDGRLDLVTVRSARSVVDVLRGDGAGSFALLQEVQVPGAAISVALADLDVDGDLDLWVALAGAVVVFENDGAASFDAMTTLAEDALGTAAVRPHDLDREGSSDLVWLSGGSQLAVARNPRVVPLGLEPYGIGTPDCAGAITLAGNGRPTVGNTDFALIGAGGPPGGQGILLLGGPQDLAGSDPLGLGVRIHVGTGALTLRFVVADGVGGLLHPETIPATGALAGLDVFAQTLWQARAGENCSASVTGVVTSRGLRLTLQQ